MVLAVCCYLERSLREVRGANKRDQARLQARFQSYQVDDRRGGRSGRCRVEVASGDGSAPASAESSPVADEGSTSCSEAHAAGVATTPSKRSAASRFSPFRKRWVEMAITEDDLDEAWAATEQEEADGDAPAHEGAAQASENEVEGAQHAVDGAHTQDPPPELRAPAPILKKAVAPTRSSADDSAIGATRVKSGMPAPQLTRGPGSSTGGGGIGTAPPKRLPGLTASMPVGSPTRGSDGLASAGAHRAAMGLRSSQSTPAIPSRRLQLPSATKTDSATRATLSPIQREPAAGAHDSEGLACSPKCDE